MLGIKQGSCYMTQFTMAKGEEDTFFSWIEQSVLTFLSMIVAMGEIFQFFLCGLGE